MKLIRIKNWLAAAGIIASVAVSTYGWAIEQENRLLPIINYGSPSIEFTNIDIGYIPSPSGSSSDFVGLSNNFSTFTLQGPGWFGTGFNGSMEINAALSSDGTLINGTFSVTSNDAIFDGSEGVVLRGDLFSFGWSGAQGVFEFGTQNLSGFIHAYEDWSDSSYPQQRLILFVDPFDPNVDTMQQGDGLTMVGDVNIPQVDIPQPPVNVSVYYADAASAKDVGPKTGTFDIFLIPPGPVGDNGYEENRTALEFDISEIPTGSTIQSTTLTLNYTLVTDPIRQISLYGYPGNGLVYDQSQINTDFTAGVHIQDSNLAIGQPDVEYDATLFVQDLIDDGNSYAGFNLRESATAGCCGLNVIFILEGEFTQPVLEISYVEPTPAKQIMILSEKVVELNTKNGISNAMDSKLKNAYEALDDSNQKNDGAAANTMQAFINSVDAQRGKEITDEEADSLNAAAQEIIDSLNK